MLRRVVGLTFSIAAVIGGTIGTGILRTPGTIAGLLGDPYVVLATWIACGALVVISANSMAELAAALPRAGGPYEYCKVAFGRGVGFAVGWSDWLTNVCALAFMAVASAEFLELLLRLPDSWTPRLALAVLVVLGGLNWYGLRLSSKVQEALSFAKVAGLVAIVVACFVHVASTSHIELSSPARGGVAATLGSAGVLFGVVRSMQLMYETYQGWNSGVYFAEEDRAGGHNVPRAMFIGIGVIIAVYVLINLAVLLVVPMARLAGSKLAVADAAEIVFGPAARDGVTVLALVTLLSLVNVTLMFTTRVLFALGRDGLGIRRAANVNAWGTPGTASVIILVVAGVMAMVGSFETLFEITATLGMSVNCAVMLALFRLRRTQPELPRPYRARGYPWLPAVALATTLTLLVAICVANPRPSGVAVGLLALSYPAYRWLERGARGAGQHEHP